MKMRSETKEILAMLSRRLPIFLQGPPKSGKSFLAKDAVRKWLTAEDGRRFGIIVEGWKN